MNNEEKRVCSECKSVMLDGYCVNGGCEYYCSDECLHKNYTDEEWEAMYEEGGDSYWSTWY